MLVFREQKGLGVVRVGLEAIQVLAKDRHKLVVLVVLIRRKERSVADHSDTHGHQDRGCEDRPASG